MPDLSTIQGASLQPRGGEAFKLLQEGIKTFQTRGLAETLAGAPSPEQEKQALVQLSTINPQVAQSIQGVLNRNNILEQQAVAKEIREGVELQARLRGKDHNGQRRILMGEGRRLVAEGKDPRRVLELEAMGKDQLRNELDRMQIAGTAMKTLLEKPAKLAALKVQQDASRASFLKNIPPEQRATAFPELRFRAQQEGDTDTVNLIDQLGPLSAQQQDIIFDDISRRAPAGKLTGVAPGQTVIGPRGGVVFQAPPKPDKPTDKFEPVLDAAGNVVAQRNKTTGEVKTDPRAPAAPKETFTPLFDSKGNVVAQKSSTGKIISDPRIIKETTLIQNMRAIGLDPETPEGAQFAKDVLKKPTVVIKENEGLFKLPTGFMLADPNDPTKGVVPIPGGPKDNLTGENAGKAQMLRTARKAAEGIRGFVFKKDGKLDKVNLFNAKFKTPGTAGRELANKMEFGIQAITRIETGAAMPDSELDNTRERFMPSPFDSDKIADLKLEMFNDFMSGTLKLLDPTGRFDEERFQAELQGRGGEEVVTPAAKDRSELTPEQKSRLEQLRQKQR